MMLSENGVRNEGLPDRNGVRLPKGVSHGSIAAVRLGCICPRCMERRKKARKRGFKI